MFYTFATIRYYSDRGTSVVRTLRPNLVASSLLIPNFSLADQVLEIICTSSSISFLWPRALMFANRSIRLLDLLSGVLFLGHQVKFIVSESFGIFSLFPPFPQLLFLGFVRWFLGVFPSFSICRRWRQPQWDKRVAIPNPRCSQASPISLSCSRLQELYFTPFPVAINFLNVIFLSIVDK